MKEPSASQIQKFCNNCDLLTSEGKCSLDIGTEESTALHLEMERLLRETIHGFALDEQIELPAAMTKDLDARVEGWTKQQRYVARNLCGWASINEKNGTMTKEGFVEYDPTA